MSLKEQFIKATQREGLIYKTADYLIFQIQQHANCLLRGHIYRHQSLQKYLTSHPQPKLHLGSGTFLLPGYFNSDLFGQNPIDITSPLPLPRNTFHTIFSYHLIEHIYRRQFSNFLREAYRILQPNGIMVAGTPSLAKISRTLYCSPQSSQAITMLNYHAKFSRDKKPTPADYLNDVTHLCFGHKYLYDLPLIRQIGLAAGFQKVNSIPADQVADDTIRSALPPTGSFRDLQSEIFIFHK